MASSVRSPEFDEWLRAVSGSDAVQQLVRIALSPIVVSVTLDDGTTVDLAEDSGHAIYTLAAWEVFARSYCQWITVRSGDPALAEELGRALQNHYPEGARPL